MQLRAMRKTREQLNGCYDCALYHDHCEKILHLLAKWNTKYKFRCPAIRKTRKELNEIRAVELPPRPWPKPKMKRQ